MASIFQTYQPLQNCQHFNKTKMLSLRAVSPIGLQTGVVGRGGVVVSANKLVLSEMFVLGWKLFHTPWEYFAPY